MTQVRLLITLLLLSFCLRPSYAESQGSEYRGVTDPFGDPTSYEFAEDEKDDKEFFHLGRFLMLGIDIGMGVFTGGLGKTAAAGFYVGGRMVYFFDKCLAFEGSLHYARHTDVIEPDTTNLLKIDTKLIPITVGFRYYFDVKNAPKALAIANPYLSLAGGIYIRQQDVISAQGAFPDPGDNASSNNGGFSFGGGAEFLIYRRHIYMGADFRYHFIFFNDEDETFNNILEEGDRAGDYFSAVLSITYNF